MGWACNSPAAQFPSETAAAVAQAKSEQGSERADAGEVPLPVLRMTRRMRARVVVVQGEKRPWMGPFYLGPSSVGEGLYRHPIHVHHRRCSFGLLVRL